LEFRRVLFRSAVEADAPPAEADGARGVRERGLELVLAHDERESALDVDAPEDVHDAPSELRVEARGGLVGEDHVRRLREGAGDRDALLLAARERVGPALGEMREADLGQALECLRAVIRREPAEHARERAY